MVNNTIEELRRLAKWVRDAREYDSRNDPVDSIARAIENRVRELERQEKLTKRAASHLTKVVIAAVEGLGPGSGEIIEEMLAIVAEGTKARRGS